MGLLPGGPALRPPPTRPASTPARGTSLPITTSDGSINDAAPPFGRRPLQRAPKGGVPHLEDRRPGSRSVIGAADADREAPLAGSLGERPSSTDRSASGSCLERLSSDRHQHALPRPIRTA